MGTSYLKGRYCGMQRPALSETIDIFAPPPACTESSGTVTASQQEGRFPVG